MCSRGMIRILLCSSGDVHGGGWGMWGRGACMVGDIHGEGHVAGGVHGGGHV